MLKNKQAAAVEVKKGNVQLIRIRTKDIVRSQASIARFTVMKTNLDSLLTRMSTMKAQKSLVEAVKVAGAAMRSMNAEMKQSNVAATLNDFAKQANALDHFQEEMDVRVGAHLRNIVPSSARKRNLTPPPLPFYHTPLQDRMDDAMGVDDEAELAEQAEKQIVQELIGKNNIAVVPVDVQKWLGEKVPEAGQKERLGGARG
jgi:hypothetical protein